MKKICFLLICCLTIWQQTQAAYLLINMDEEQKDHLKAYGIAYYALDKGINVDWLLNYRGGSFAIEYNKLFEAECRIRGVSYEVVPDAQYTTMLQKLPILKKIWIW